MFVHLVFDHFVRSWLGHPCGGRTGKWVNLIKLSEQPSLNNGTQRIQLLFTRFTTKFSTKYLVCIQNLVLNLVRPYPGTAYIYKTAVQL